MNLKILSARLTVTSDVSGTLVSLWAPEGRDGGAQLLAAGEDFEPPDFGAGTLESL